MNLPPVLYLVNSLLMTMKTSCVKLVICILYLWIAISCFILITNWNCVGDWKSQHIVDHTELERSKIVLPRDWSEEPNKPLETLLFCLFYICSTRSLLPLSQGSGFTYFLLTATQPGLRTEELKKTSRTNTDL